MYKINVLVCRYFLSTLVSIASGTISYWPEIYLQDGFMIIINYNNYVHVVISANISISIMNGAHVHVLFESSALIGQFWIPGTWLSADILLRAYRALDTPFSLLSTLDIIWYTDDEILFISIRNIQCHVYSNDNYHVYMCMSPWACDHKWSIFPFPTTWSQVSFMNLEHAWWFNLGNSK